MIKFFAITEYLEIKALHNCLGFPIPLKVKELDKETLVAKTISLTFSHSLLCAFYPKAIYISVGFLHGLFLLSISSIYLQTLP